MPTNVEWTKGTYLGYLIILFSGFLLIQVLLGLYMELYFPIYFYQVVLIPFGIGLVECCSIVLFTEILLNLNKRLIRSKKMKREFKEWSPFLCFLISTGLVVGSFVGIFSLVIIVFGDPLILPIIPYFLKYTLAQVLGCIPLLFIFIIIEEFFISPT